MSSEKVFTHRDAEPRSIRDLDFAILHRKRLLDQFMEQRIGVERIFDDEAGRRCGSDV